MTLPYGFVKATLTSAPVMRSTRHRNEIQYHLHFGLDVAGANWDVAVNVGTNDADDLLKYKLVYDFRHNFIHTLAPLPKGAKDLTGQSRLPALDFMRSDILANTGRWRESDVMDGSASVEPAASLRRLLETARGAASPIYIFGRFYSEGNGMHDIHMNQGSTKDFIHRPGNDHNDHNDIWQDGAVMVDIGQPEWVAYFSVFEQQLVPTNNLGNPRPGARPV